MPDMKLLSINVGQPKPVAYVDRRGRRKTTATAIFKTPVAGRVRLRALNLDGDGQADLVGHGGADKAVYVYSVENYRYWADELGRTDFDPAGQFGENFTVEGMADDAVAIGDEFRIGGALVQITQPRVPCFKLGVRMGIADFQKPFAASCRVGFYLRVLEEGEVGAGDAIEPVRQATPRMSVSEMMHLLYFDPDNLAATRTALEIDALSPGWRQSFADRIEQAAGG
ncbi:MAG: MOSC domain-containing protein [Alphaproteobacteria bacterium]